MLVKSIVTGDLSKTIAKNMELKQLKHQQVLKIFVERQMNMMLQKKKIMFLDMKKA